MTLPCIAYNVPDKLFESVAGLFRKVGVQEQVSVVIQSRTSELDHAARLIRAMEGICLVLVYVAPLTKAEDGKNALRLGRFAIDENPDHYVIYCAADTQTLVDMASYCRRAAGLMVASTIIQRGERMMIEIFQDYKKLTASTAAESQKSLVLKTKGSVARIALDNICALMSANKQVEVHEISGKTTVVYATLEKLQEQLDERFLVCHRGCIINQNCIQYVDYRSMSIIMTDGLEVPLSRVFRKTFRNLGDERSDEPEEEQA